MFKQQSQTNLRDSSLSCVPAHMLVRVWQKLFLLSIALIPFACMAEIVFTKYRLDTFYFNLLGTDNDNSELWGIVKLVLMLSLGNASVESGFSLNSDILVDNLHEESLVARRIMYDTIQKVTVSSRWKIARHCNFKSSLRWSIEKEMWRICRPPGKMRDYFEKYAAQDRIVWVCRKSKMAAINRK